MEENKPVLHLMVNNTCMNDCPLCCNKQYDVEQIPVVTVDDLKSVDTICYTGGQLFIHIIDFFNFVLKLEKQYKNIKKSFFYMNGAELYPDVYVGVSYLRDFPIGDVEYGLTMSPKSEKDWKVIAKMAKVSNLFGVAYKSNRIYCFSDNDEVMARNLLHGTNVEIVRREWQSDFKPAPNTIFRRLPIWI